MCVWVHVCAMHARLCIWLCMCVCVCVLFLTSGYKSLIIHHALICYKPVKSMHRKMPLNSSQLLSLSFALILSLCLSRSVPLFSFHLSLTLSPPPVCIDISQPHLSLSISLSLCILLIYLLFLFVLSHFPLCLFSSLSLSALHGHPKRKIDDRIKIQRQKCGGDLKEQFIILGDRFSHRKHWNAKYAFQVPSFNPVLVMYNKYVKYFILFSLFCLSLKNSNIYDNSSWTTVTRCLSPRVPHIEMKKGFRFQRSNLSGTDAFIKSVFYPVVVKEALNCHSVFNAMPVSWILVKPSPPSLPALRTTEATVGRYKGTNCTDFEEYNGGAATTTKTDNCTTRWGWWTEILSYFSISWKSTWCETRQETYRHSNRDVLMNKYSPTQSQRWLPGRWCNSR